jgi:hypothetical protein
MVQVFAKAASSFGSYSHTFGATHAFTATILGIAGASGCLSNDFSITVKKGLIEGIELAVEPGRCDGSGVTVDALARLLVCRAPSCSPHIRFLPCG